MNRFILFSITLFNISVTFINISLASTGQWSEQQQENLFFEFSLMLNNKNIISESQWTKYLQKKNRAYHCTSENETCLTLNQILVKAIDQVSDSPTVYHIKNISSLMTAHFNLFTNIEKGQAYKAFQRLTHQSIASWGDKIQAINIRTKMSLPSEKILQDLLLVEPRIDLYKSGRYAHHPRVYMFCRNSRSYPCLMIVKNSDGSFRTLEDGQTLWSQPGLGLSAKNQNFDQPNGNTPSGVWRIDGVMPIADKTMVFGKNRRLILNFVAESENESDQKLLLPPSHHEESWWQETTVARQMGRGLFRIHGTGIKSNPQRNYYPFVPTSGCIAKRENIYDNISYFDQREFLDTLMRANNQEPKYENETDIRALLYVINMDNQNSAVTLSDITKLLE